MKLLQLLELLLRKTLNSVVFGITIMALTAIYVAVGSGLPSVREYFEMNEMQFFNAWPLKVLMTLLVLNLAVVTWMRIPFTPPRYGVWCVHSGIVVLVMGMAYHYMLKTEGLTMINLGQSVEHYYDAYERSLYAQVGIRRSAPVRLGDLPRFKSYSRELGNAGYLDRASLRNLSPWLASGTDPASGRPARRTIGEELGVPDLKIDILGYWPYAIIEFEGFVRDPGVRNTGLQVRPVDHADADPQWLVASEPGQAGFRFENVELQHKHFSTAEGSRALVQAVQGLHRLTVVYNDQRRELSVQPGQTYTLDDLGVTLDISSFVPNWTTIDGQWRGAALLMKVTTTGSGRTFNRMVLDGPEVQTDFDIDDPSGGPLGKRLTTPIDPNLTVLYRFSDPLRLMPTEVAQRRMLVTTDESEVLGEGVGGIASPTSGRTPDTRDTVIEVGPAPAGPMGRPAAPGASLRLAIERFDDLRPNRKLTEVPRELRDRNAGQMGIFQVLLVRLSAGQWSTEVYVPYQQWALESGWGGPQILIPGAEAPLSLRLGNTVWSMPARIRLDRFEAIPYPGGEVSASQFMRDFRSHLTIVNREGRTETGTARMNEPHYYDNGRWLFYQAQWDPEAQAFTVLGVGNRPGVWIMTLGCVMIGFGLLWAFYLKPVIIRRMKEKALAAAAASGKLKREPVAV